MNPLSFQTLQVLIDAQFVNGPQGRGSHRDLHRLTRLRNEEGLLLKIGQKPALALHVGVGHLVTHHRFLTGQLTLSGHDIWLFRYL